MAMLDTQQATRLEQTWSVMRILGLAICAGAPLTYGFVLYIAAFHGDGAAFMRTLRGAAGPLPWRQPVLPVLLLLSAVMLGQVLFLRGLFARQARNAASFEEALARLRTGTIICCALLESVAVFGLVLGFVASPAALPLDLALMAVPVVGYVFLVPDLAFWRKAIDEASFR